MNPKTKNRRRASPSIKFASESFAPKGSGTPSVTATNGENSRKNSGRPNWIVVAVKNHRVVWPAHAVSEFNDWEAAY